MTIHDTLTARLADLHAERAKLAEHIEDLERHLRMGRDWVVENAEHLAARFAHLFPAAYAETVVDPAPLLPAPVGEVLPLVVVKSYSDGATAMWEDSPLAAGEQDPVPTAPYLGHVRSGFSERRVAERRVERSYEETTARATDAGVLTDRRIVTRRRKHNTVVTITGE